MTWQDGTYIKEGDADADAELWRQWMATGVGGLRARVQHLETELAKEPDTGLGDEIYFLEKRVSQIAHWNWLAVLMAGTVFGYHLGGIYDGWFDTTWLDDLGSALGMVLAYMVWRGGRKIDKNQASYKREVKKYLNKTG